MRDPIKGHDTSRRQFMEGLPGLSVFEKCDGYLDARTGTYDFRCRRYDAVIDVIENYWPQGLEATMTIVDLAAGWTEFGHRLTERGFRGRYIPLDGGIDGRNLQYWEPPRTKVDWVVAIEFLEHLHHPERLVQTMFEKAQNGVIITTPNSDVVDTLGLDPDHVTALTKESLHKMGFQLVEAKSLFTKAEDTLIGWRYA